MVKAPLNILLIKSTSQVKITYKGKYIVTDSLSLFQSAETGIFIVLIQVRAYNEQCLGSCKVHKQQ